MSRGGSYPIRKFDDRFARQNRCEPPPEFPLASPYSRIVHHLSGPSSYARTQILWKTSGSVDGAPGGSHQLHFHCAYGFDARTLAQTLDSLVRVSRRDARCHYASALAGARSSAGAGRIAPRAATPPEGPNSRGFYPAAPAGAGPPPGEYAGPKACGTPGGAFWPRALPLRQFHVLFDSLSKVLFIFRSLYLCAIGLRRVFSLGWNLPPVLSCIPKQLDSSMGLRAAGGPARTRGSHPLWRPVPGDLGRAPRRSHLCRLQLGPQRGRI